MYRVSKQLWFCAGPIKFRLSETRCEALHGHNYRVLVTRRRKRPGIGPATSSISPELKKAAVEICARFDHGNLNEIEPFAKGSESHGRGAGPGICASSWRKSSTTSACGIYKVEILGKPTTTARNTCHEERSRTASTQASRPGSGAIAWRRSSRPVVVGVASSLE